MVVDRPDDAGAVAAGLARVLQDPQLRLSMSIAGRQRAQNEFSYDTLAARLGEALRSRK